MPGTTLKKPLSDEIVVDSESDSESSQNSSDSDIKAIASKRTEEAAPKKVVTPASVDDKSSGTDSETSSTDPSSSSEDEEDGQAVTSASKKRAAPETQEVTKAKRPRYEPPKGYSRSTKGVDSRPVTTSSLKSKQLWHITAPAHMPLEALVSGVFKVSAEEQAIASHDNVEYAAADETQKLISGTAGLKSVLLVPGEGNKFRSIKLPVVRTLHFRKRLDLAIPQTTTPPTPEAHVLRADRVIRSQPMGLRMRYRPPGFGSGRPGKIGGDSADDESDEDMPDVAPPTFKRPPRKSHGGKTGDLERKNGVLQNGRSPASDEEQVESEPQSSKPSQEDKEAKRQRKEERRLKRLRKEEKRKSREVKAGGQSIAV